MRSPWIATVKLRKMMIFMDIWQTLSDVACAIDDVEAVKETSHANTMFKTLMPIDIKNLTWY